MEEIEELSPLRVASTVQALSSALRGNRENAPAANRSKGDRVFPDPEKLWFKESSAKNLRNRDFLSPATVLNTLYADGQVPPAVMSRVLSLRGSGVLPVAGAEVMGEGLRLRVDRAAAFKAVLAGQTADYLKPSSQKEGCVLINCPALHPKIYTPTPETLTLGQLRTVLLADHMGALLRSQGFSVFYCPKLPKDGNIVAFLRALGIDWPTAAADLTYEEQEEQILKALESSIYREEGADRGRKTCRGGGGDGGKKVEEEEENEGALRINLKRVFQEEGLLGYDPSLGTCTVQRDSISQLAQLDLCTADCTDVTVTVLHVTSCQDEFRQQQMAMLWRASGAPHAQAEKRSDEGGVRDEVRRSSRGCVCMQTGLESCLCQTWDDIIKVMTSATVRFELLSTVHTSPVTLDVQKEGGVSTKGPRGGVFVMYNCARLHTLFDSYERGVEKGLYPEIPEGSQLDFSALKEEGEWLLLFNYLIPFSELLDQSGQAIGYEGGGARANIKTEQICKFLVSLSKDFSSYYNRVHVLGEPLPHLFNQMFCRLYLLRALRELYHSALETLNLPPIRQL
ncbi:DALR anticodon-binding domain-containing protein 3 isoform X2 [Oryzias latipes]|uniref:DALR anticodon-binding domain-containing protein 3 isoform X2 n=1 Tax=Oryzias latipes TaxID=8090 RepID=UPI000CE21051|nr:DALR anticodon-binding domain-containing protein 3 isoform X2 [Oryzias latipes]